jgi:hypothetical protein
MHFSSALCTCTIVLLWGALTFPVLVDCSLIPHLVLLRQVTADSSKMIDPEFAYVGPIAFDPAKIIAELLIPYFAADGHEAAQGAGSRAGQQAWLLQCIVDVWDTFSSR